LEVFGFAGLFGLILGFMFGVGCALAVMYSIYMGGYRKAIADSLIAAESLKYVTELRKAEEKLAKEPAGATKS
jgi:hypothetical protein